MEELGILLLHVFVHVVVKLAPKLVILQTCLPHLVVFSPLVDLEVVPDGRVDVAAVLVAATPTILASLTVRIRSAQGRSTGHILHSDSMARWEVVGVGSSSCALIGITTHICLASGNLRAQVALLKVWRQGERSLGCRWRDLTVDDHFLQDILLALGFVLLPNHALKTDDRRGLLEANRLRLMFCANS